MSIRAQLALLFAVVCATTVAVSTLVALWEIDRTERIAHEELEAIGVEGVNVAIIAGGIVGGGVGLMLGFVLVRRLRRPLGDLRDGAAAVASGRFDHRVPVRGPVEVRQLATAFNGMAAAIERTDGRRQTWLDDLAHELRGPIAVIQAYSEALADGVVPAGAQREAARRAVAANAAQCGALLQAMRRELAGDPGAERTGIGPLLEGLRDRFELRAADAGVSLLVDGGDASPAFVAGDPASLARVLDNLVANGIAAAGRGGRVEVRAEPLDGAVELVVDDSGPGIPPEDRVRAFDRFWRSDQSRTRGDGQGMGLAIARAIVEREGGTVTIAESSLGGARLVVRLPPAV